MDDFIPIIGLEIHSELKTQSKLFCRCPNTSSELQTPPNTAVCPVCLGLPGALPVPNKAAIEATITLGRSLGCAVPESTKWDRKNYFYPDLPKGYQISQYDEPLCQGGTVTWYDPKDGSPHSVALTRIHLEEDTGKLTHPEGKNYSLIDYNRSGIPLLELVTEPVIASAEEAKQFAEEYQRMLRELGIAEASMEKGQMRCEANISVITTEVAANPAKRLTGTKIEIKNLNSFRSLSRAIVYEYERQSRIAREGGALRQETRGWNENRGETYVMRTKETADDYRYFPEPDLGRLDLSSVTRDSQTAGLPRVALIEKLREAGLPQTEIAISANDPDRLQCWSRLLERSLQPNLYALALQWINQEPALTKFLPQEITQGLTNLNDKRYSAALFKQALLEAAPGELIAVIDRRQQANRVDNLEAVVEKVLINNTQAVANYQAGKVQLLGYFIGQVKKELGGKGDPEEIGNLVKHKLNAG